MALGIEWTRWGHAPHFFISSLVLQSSSQQDCSETVVPCHSSARITSLSMVISRWLVMCSHIVLVLLSSCLCLCSHLNRTLRRPPVFLEDWQWPMLNAACKIKYGCAHVTAEELGGFYSPRKRAQAELSLKHSRRRPSSCLRRRTALPPDPPQVPTLPEWMLRPHLVPGPPIVKRSPPAGGISTAVRRRPTTRHHHCRRE